MQCWCGAGQGTPEFTRRQRLLALCGWDVLAIRADARGSPSVSGSIDRVGRGGGAAGPGGDAAVDATGAALCCEMCGARAGLWDFVPKMVPAARPGTLSLTAGEHTLPAVECSLQDWISCPIWCPLPGRAPGASVRVQQLCPVCMICQDLSRR